MRGSVLDDGFVCGTWRIEDGTLVVEHVEPLTKRRQSRIAAEGRRLLRFLDPGAGDRDVRFAAV